jgi:hypothetical protein
MGKTPNFYFSEQRWEAHSGKIYFEADKILLDKTRRQIIDLFLSG